MNEYWIGPYGILIPDTIKSVIDIDGINTIYKDGSSTEISNGGKVISEQIYKDRYTIYNSDDGKWYYR